ncbi:hypothetical protein VB636_11835 [Paracoccus sp. APAP_BH8]|uniref:hypothetical protein n=1 Tax=Paracoccus sp. APAP_BH8 TaxID=3110237 RepID=UPI002FD7FA94
MDGTAAGDGQVRAAHAGDAPGAGSEAAAIARALRLGETRAHRAAAHTHGRTDIRPLGLALPHCGAVLIRTERGTGYVLAAEVSRDDA